MYMHKNKTTSVNNNIRTKIRQHLSKWKEGSGLLLPNYKDIKGRLGGIAPFHANSRGLEEMAK
jgi:hypothetical protein